jgi:hypothetical protein
MKIRTWILLCSLLLPGMSFATAYTPLAWQGVVDGHANPAFNGQRKHLTWVRDQNRNFVDDEIEKRFKRAIGRHHPAAQSLPDAGRNRRTGSPGAARCCTSASSLRSWW